MNKTIIGVICIFLLISCMKDGILLNGGRLNREVTFLMNNQYLITGQAFSINIRPDYQELDIYIRFIYPRDQKEFKLYLANILANNGFHYPKQFSGCQSTRPKIEPKPIAYLTNYYAENDVPSAGYCIDTTFTNFIKINQLNKWRLKGESQFKFVRHIGSTGPDTVLIEYLNLDAIRYKG